LSRAKMVRLQSRFVTGPGKELVGHRGWQIRLGRLGVFFPFYRTRGEVGGGWRGKKEKRKERSSPGDLDDVKNHPTAPFMEKQKAEGGERKITFGQTNKRRGKKLKSREIAQKSPRVFHLTEKKKGCLKDLFKGNQKKGTGKGKRKA